MRRGCALAGALGAIVTIAPAVTATAAQRTFVASGGNDANPCSLAQPCRSFAAAVAQTNAGGEVIVLDSAGYGPTMITKAVSIVAPPGVHAAISVPVLDYGIIVAAGANDVVVLRGLSITGNGGIAGIVVGSAKEVHVENCTISNMNEDGLSVGGGAYVRIAGTTLRSNGYHGVVIDTPEATKVTIDDTHAAHNGQYGFVLSRGLRATLRNSSAVDNGSDGLRVSSLDGAPRVTVTNGEYSRNAFNGVDVSISDSDLDVGFSMFGASASRNGQRGVVVTAGGSPSAAGVSIGASRIAWNGLDGVWARVLGPSDDTRIAISRSVVSENGWSGVYAGGGLGYGAIVSVSANTIARNGQSDLRRAFSASMLTFGNNALTGNGGSDVDGSLTSRSLR